MFEGLVGIGKGGGVRPLVALEPLGDRVAGVSGEALLLGLEARDCGGGDGDGGDRSLATADC